MAKGPIQTKIQLRRDTSTNWSSNNSVLAAGEIGIDTTVNRMKVGDGATTWNNLAFANTKVSVEENAPSNPVNGDVWFKIEIPILEEAGENQTDPE